MTYMKNGGLIRMVADRDLPRFAAMGFVPLAVPGKKPAAKSAGKPKEGKPHGGA